MTSIEANDLIYETFNGKFGVVSIEEHDQIEGIYDTYEEALNKVNEIIKSNNLKLK